MFGDRSFGMMAYRNIVFIVKGYENARVCARPARWVLVHNFRGVSVGGGIKKGESTFRTLAFLSEGMIYPKPIFTAQTAACVLSSR